MMKKHLRKFETTMWLFIKMILYVLLLMTFVLILGRDNIGLTRMSRTLGITVSTFIVVGLLFLSTYGSYDVGRRKNKPIINSLSLAVVCTDLVTYLQVMIMRTNVPTAWEFRLLNLSSLLLVIVVQLIIIRVFVFMGNGLFFKIHKPQKCCIITSSQESLNKVAPAIARFKKQYQVTDVLDWHCDTLEDYVRKSDSVFIYDVPSKTRTQIMEWSYKYKVNVYFNPEIEDVMELNAKQYVLGDTYLMNKEVKTLTMEQRIIKRLFDIIFSVVLGILSMPFWLLGMIMVKLNDGGPIIFKQERATINGKRFDVYKLRTMKPNAENYSVVKDDDRITKPGKFLRRTRIDELPQLWNVLKGDMTFVGPRPEMIKNVQKYTDELPEFEYRLRMKAGLTGYAQITGKYNTSPKDKLIMDMMYIEQFSILKDIQLMFQTAVVLLRADSTEAFDRGNKEEIYKFTKWIEK